MDETSCADARERRRVNGIGDARRARKRDRQALHRPHRQIGPGFGFETIAIKPAVSAGTTAFSTRLRNQPHDRLDCAVRRPQ